MRKESIKLIKYLGIIFIALVLSYKLPHDSYSLIQYIIKPIRLGSNCVLYLSGIIPLIFIIIGIKGIFGLEKFAKINRIMIILFIFAVVIPFMNWTIDFARINYYSLKDDGINSIDIKESEITLGNSNDDIIINISIELKDYSRRRNEFRMRVFLPKSLSECIGTEYYELENNYATNGNNHTFNVNEQIFVDTENADRLNKLLDTVWYWEDVKYELYNDEETVNIIEHGF